MVVKKEFERDTFPKNSLVSMYVSFGAMEDARTLFDGMNEPGDVVLWTTMVGGYMKFGMVYLALKLFDEMPDSNDVAWGVVIAGCVKNRRYKDALSIFYDMLQCTNVKPNEASLVCALSACAHLGALDQGLVDQGRHFFHGMQQFWGIVPTVEHYGCIVDLLGRAGFIDQAMKIAKCMPIEPDIVIWRALLTACRIHENLALAEEIMHHVERCDPLDHEGSKILLSSMYASSNCWDGVARVRGTMCKQRIQLVLGWSSTEVKGVIHEFVAGDRTHPRAADIYQKLDEIFNRLQTVGYCPSTLQISLELSEEDKRASNVIGRVRN
ncbi:pentatricopeptide repeat-containing protein At4g02750-like [Nymphaea colorata]|uniref:pentatricopeptide repeat-containing protein At4g02750-like n=1 Tax=Nymphaea colorata TaxID=210225 RepID=UPI00129E7631|nr:pentatricopeptide repeat-containing protein At4g02750-like [Nymphaea colorata]